MGEQGEKAFSTEMQAKLSQFGEIVRCRKGSAIFNEREDEGSFYIVLKGYVLLYRNSRFGEDKMIFICSAGEMLNEEILERPKPAASAKALSEVELLKIERAVMCDLMQRDHAAAAEVYRSLAEKTRRLYHQIGTSGHTYTLDKRLAAKLLRLSRDYGIDTEEGRKIAFELTVTFLAGMVGAKRETVSRELSQLKSDGVIRHEEGFITILDENTLRSRIE